MSSGVPESARRAFERHDAFEERPDGFALTTTAFESVVRVRDAAGDDLAYDLEIRIPSLDAATEDHVGSAVQTGWFETMERRLEEAPKTTRSAVELDRFRFADGDADDLVVTYEFTWDDADRAAAIAKAFAEYVEGTYVESVVPGYDYRGTVAELLGRASQTDEGGGGGPTPL